MCLLGFSTSEQVFQQSRICWLPGFISTGIVVPAVRRANRPGVCSKPILCLLLESDPVFLSDYANSEQSKPCPGARCLGSCPMPIFRRLWCVYEWVCGLLIHDAMEIEILADPFVRDSTVAPGNWKNGQRVRWAQGSWELELSAYWLVCAFKSSIK